MLQFRRVSARVCFIQTQLRFHCDQFTNAMNRTNDIRIILIHTINCHRQTSKIIICEKGIYLPGKCLDFCCLTKIGRSISMTDIMLCWYHTHNGQKPYCSSWCCFETGTQINRLLPCLGAHRNPHSLISHSMLTKNSSTRSTPKDLRSQIQVKIRSPHLVFSLSV